ncbi:MAG: NF038122 family metalloprotease [Cyanobacteria bacterium P01_G01_bin.38]
MELYSSQTLPGLRFDNLLLKGDGTAIASPQPEPRSSLIGELAATSHSTGLKFTFNALPGVPQAIIDGFVTAGNLWSAHFTDDVTVNIDIAFESLGSETLGDSISTQYNVPYRLGREKLIEDSTSFYDLLATNSLPDRDSIPILINYTAENTGQPIPYLDNDGSGNNANLRITSANAKAIGLSVEETYPDGLIRFNRDIRWDLNRSNGITPGATDFIGVAIHEIGHILGFDSQVDRLDTLAANGYAPVVSEDHHKPTPFDLFRFSADSFAIGAIDLTADDRDKYFSFYRGENGTPLSTGKYLGNGDQASHWKDISIGIMDATLRTGTQSNITIFDRIAFDVIGWDLA